MIALASKKKEDSIELELIKDDILHNNEVRSYEEKSFKIDYVLYTGIKHGGRNMQTVAAEEKNRCKSTL